MGGPAVKYCTAHQRSTGTLTASSTHAPMVKILVRVRRSFSDTPAAGGAEEMGYSKPSVSRAVGILKKNGYIIMDGSGHLYLTDEGRSVAEKTFERHRVLTKVFTKLGVSAGIAAEDACKIEHVISDETFEAIKRFVAEHSD